MKKILVNSTGHMTYKIRSKQRITGIKIFNQDNCDRYDKIQWEKFVTGDWALTVFISIRNHKLISMFTLFSIYHTRDNPGGLGIPWGEAGRPFSGDMRKFNEKTVTGTSHWAISLSNHLTVFITFIP